MSAHVEALLLSAVVRTGEHQQLAASGITSGMFHAHQEEAEWVERFIARNGKAPSKTALRQAFPEFKVWRVDDTAHYCDEVRKEHVRQSLVDLMESSLTYLDANDMDKAISHMETGLRVVQVEQEGVSADFSVFDDWESIYDSVSAKVDKVRNTGWAGIPSGFKTLDDLTGGFQQGWFCVVAARLGQGKTWTGVKIGYTAAMHGHKVAYFSLEQPRVQIAMRVHSFASRQYAKEVFNSMDLNRGKGFDLRAYKKFCQELQAQRGQGDFYINDSSRGVVTPSTIAAIVEKKQPEIIVIDYLTLLGTTGDDWRSTARLSNELQVVAQRYNIPVVALSQVNRLGIGKEPPGAEHLSQADAIGQDADMVLTMTQRSKTVNKMRLAKFRHGPGGDTWFAKFSPGTGEYEEITGDQADVLIEADQEEY